MSRIAILALLIACALLGSCSKDSTGRPANDPRIESLAELSVEFLRSRSYGSQVRIEQTVSKKAWPSYLASYQSDGLRVYTRIDLPSTPAPEGGFPVVLLVHGWLGIDAARNTDFFYDSSSTYAAVIDAYVEAGFAVFVPGWRGHGVVNGRPADGIEFMQAWDNGSYLSPAFYSIDVLNLLDSVQTIELAPLNLDAINLFGHSQGGDVALMVLAISGEDSAVRNTINAATIWSGNIPSRLTQLRTFWPMQTSPQAFLSGDGSWNGTAVGKDGALNADFVFGYPPDWIGTVLTEEWTWQKDQWSNATVAEALEVKLGQMYSAIKNYVVDMPDVSYTIQSAKGVQTTIKHDARVEAALQMIGGFDQAQYLTEPLALHHSDRDFYSLPEWNLDLCERANMLGGRCQNFSYPGNTHSLGVSEHEWYSPVGSLSGFPIAIQRDIVLFSGKMAEKIDAESP